MKVDYFKNGKFYTMENEKDFCTHLVAIDGVVAFCSNSEIPLERYKNKQNCKVLEHDLHGKTVIPSFCDSHLHFSFGATVFKQIDLSDCRSKEEFLNVIDKYYNKTKNDWIIGAGWDKNNWKDGKNPTYKDLEKYNDKFIALYSKDYHAIVVNEPVIKLFHLNNITENDINKYNLNKEDYYNSILYDNSQNLSGVFYDSSMGYISAKIDDFIKREDSSVQKDMKDLINHMHGLGITAVGDCSQYWKDSSFRHFKELEQEDVKLRNMVCVTRDSFDRFNELGLKTGIGSDRLKVGPLKIIYDGSLGSETGLMFEPYENSDKVGLRNISYEKLREISLKAVSNGFGLAIHAIGDKANYEVVSIFQEAMGISKSPLLRLEHAQTIDDNTIKKLEKLPVYVCMQPIHIDQDVGSSYKLLGDRANLLYRFRSLANKGLKLSFSTDFPVAGLNPFNGIYCAVTHKGFNFSDKILNSSETLSVFDAVKNYTFYAHQSCLFNRSGLIKEGYFADFAVLDKDIFNLSKEEEILDIKVVDTYFEGEKLCM